MGAEHALAAVIVLGLVAYLLGGGADFGGGVWDLLARGPRRDAQRALIERAIGPIWEANHVWFVFVFVLLFSGFPPAFAHLTTALFAPLTFYAVGIVVRGAAFTFRHYAGTERQRSMLGRLFSIASVVCPLLLGAMGALLLQSGELRGDPAALVDPFVIAAAFFVLALVAALAATYLTVEAEGAPDVQSDFRVRALVALVVAGACSWAAVLASTTAAPALFDTVVVRGAAAVTTLLGLATLAAVTVRRYRLARALVVLLASSVVVAWAAAKGELLVPPSDTLSGTKAHAGTLRVLLTATGLGAVVLVPSLVLLFRTFGGPRQPRSSSPSR